MAAFYFTTAPLLFASSLLLALALALPFMIFASENLISVICSKSINPPLCLKALKSDPRSANANLRSLAQISIDLAQASAKETSTMVELLTKNATNRRLKAQYQTCTENYDDAISNLADANNFLKSGDFESLNVYASAVVTDADTCEDSFVESPGSVEPRQLKQANKKLEDFANIILVIAHRLAGLES